MGRSAYFPNTLAFTVLGEGEIKISTGSKDIFLADWWWICGSDQGEGFDPCLPGRYCLDELNEKAILEAQAYSREIVTSNVKGEELAAAQAVLQRSVLEDESDATPPYATCFAAWISLIDRPRGTSYLPNKHAYAR